MKVIDIQNITNGLKDLSKPQQDIGHENHRHKTEDDMQKVLSRMDAQFSRLDSQYKRIEHKLDV
ncbi:MAG: hypothetical protein ACMUEM_00275 [Flavobacteriales bacterium AspAUS03]